MDRAGLGPAAEFLFSQGLAKATAKRYEAVWKKYEYLCRELDVTPLPVTEEKAITYVVLLAQEGMQAATVKYHLAGLRQAQIKAGLQAPDWGAMARLCQIRTGIARLRATQGTVSSPRNPVTLRHLQALQVVWSKAGDRGVMLWAAACLCFFGCLRAGEALAPEDGRFDPNANLTFKDITVDSLVKPRRLDVRIKESKTDRFRRGATVSVGWTGESVCPVKALIAFIVKRKKGPGPFFVDGDGKALTRRVFVAETKKALEQAGLPSHDISGHSFRIGAATAASLGGASDAEVKTFGRWRSREYQGYIRKDSLSGSTLSKKLVGARGWDKDK